MSASSSELSSPTIASSAAFLGSVSSFWRNVLLALKGEHHDYTATPLKRAVLLLAVPMVLEMFMESLFAIADVFWVSHLGKEAIAVVGITETMMTLIYAVAIGLCIAATAVVARRIGEKHPLKAAQAAGQTIVLGILCAITLGILLGSNAATLLRWMGADAATIAVGANFTRLMLGVNITVFLIFLINAVFRGAGDAVRAMRTLWLANALNIILGPCFIFGLGPFPALGVTGAAVATNLGRGIGVAYQLYHLTRHGGPIHVRWNHLLPTRAGIAQILRPAWSGIGQFMINTTTWIVLMRILAVFGSSALAGYTIAVRAFLFALFPAWGLANAAATLVGQNLGARQPERAKEAVKIAARYNLIFLGAVGALYVVFAHPIISAFTNEPAVLANGTRALWIISLAFPVYAIGMCLSAAFNGAGDTWTVTKLNLVSFWLVEVPLAWLLAKKLGLGPLGVFIAVPTSLVLFTALSAVAFASGRWQKTKV